MANRIAKLRRIQGDMSRTQLGARLGVSEYTVARWEKEKTGIPDDHKLAMAKLFKVDPSYLMGWTNRNGNGGKVA